ncbi:hypothetical protein BDV37DRAFT_280412 [Aspergillus pseudonomiae]|uniref:Uncharacterized protein n=1 Tax=Aspergillus pseudonomiae TaxID=1506151 RepID=A0A5N7DK45_9EURO|nr:uncharacterized protein BDV37DRAFT_280412 [Aspergillus pseudonomiae]KAE8406802.1 hypothetical protein BDV37DRAFT_280412 [Aspergillus pseudonomiae]
MPFYASLDATYERGFGHENNYIFALQQYKVESTKSALSAAERGEYSIISLDGHGLGGLCGNGIRDEFLVELDQNDQDQEPTVEDTAKFVELGVKSQLERENRWLKRLQDMKNAGILTLLGRRWSERRQFEFLTNLRELDEGAYQGMFELLKQVVELAHLNSGSITWTALLVPRE